MDFQHEKSQSAAIEALPPLRRPLVAILPFAAAEGDPLLRMLGADVADLLRERLMQDPALQAILISSDFLAKAPPHALELVCRELGVGYLVSGKCHGQGETASLYVELTDTRNWHIRWAHFFGGNARGLLAPEGADMTRLVAALRHELVEIRRR